MPDGRPYLVMDLIEGADLPTWSRRHALPIPERVRLLTRVCDAVRHAHGRGVVHRELKPGNIPARTVDGAPLPVVIDFGVARLLDPDSDATMTSLGRPIGTRRYMSPEQRSGGVADVRADVFALGVILRVEAAGLPRGGDTAEHRHRHGTAR